MTQPTTDAVIDLTDTAVATVDLTGDAGTVTLPDVDDDAADLAAEFEPQGDVDPGEQPVAEAEAEAEPEAQPVIQPVVQPVAQPEVQGQPEQDVLDLEAMPAGVRGAVEAVLMVVEEPVEEVALASALGLTVDRVTSVLLELAAEYDEAGRGFELRHVAGGWRMFSRPEYAAAVERFVLDGQTARLTQAALETLAIVAYRQPVSRARVGAIRGVNVDAVMRTLVTRGLVEEAGNDPETGAVLYRTTTYFLQRMGLGSLDELPALAPFLPEVDVLDELGMSS